MGLPSYDFHRFGMRILIGFDITITPMAYDVTEMEEVDFVI